MRKLKDELNDRKLAFNALSAKNALLEADITVSNQQHHDAQNEVKKIQIEKEQSINHIRKEHQQEKDVINHNQLKEYCYACLLSLGIIQYT